MSRPLIICAALALAPLLSACAASSDKYPSLAIRDAERVEGRITPVAPDPHPVRPVASPADITQLVEQAQAAHARFAEALPAAQSLVAAASETSIESTARQRALLALADLTSLSADTALALATLDRLEAAARTEFAPAESIASAQTVIAALVREEDEALDALAVRLRL